MDLTMRKAFGTRIKELRKGKRWTQKELAARLDIRFQQLNKYEGGFNVPPVEILLKLGELFGVTVDYLLTGETTEGMPLRNLQLMDRFREVERLKADDQEAVLKLIDAMVVKHRVEGALRPFEKQTEGSIL